MLNTPTRQNDPMTHLDDAQKNWIRSVVQREGAEAAGRIYGGPFAVDRFGRAFIKEIFGVDVRERTKVSAAKTSEPKPRAAKPKKARKKKSPAPDMNDADSPSAPADASPTAG